ncbi:vacuolar cation/proton exchanger 3-like isoform X2 [Gossypium australe]|uniref:Vacuolar cation/proton exchanger 3-like isoform X2 n=1 Tax=Gossypium australe TaxID=47621 RepID=A0A5B6V432_9ROSI|nr:vacuolar cation/proton exchanger 3-like isoform X2 [Gossypium australe]
MGSLQEPWVLENVDSKGSVRHGKTAINMSSSLLRTKSDLPLGSRVRCPMLRHFLANLHEVVLGTKLSVIFPVIPLAFVAHFYGFGRPWVFALSLLGVSALAERISFLTEQIAYYIGPTVGGLVNATCGNATELIIAIFALRQNKIDMRQAEVNCILLLLALLCHSLPLLFRMSGASASDTADPMLQLSRASSVVMLIAYIIYLVFQLFTHSQFFEAQEEPKDEEDGALEQGGGEGEEEEEEAVIGFWSAFVWLVGLTALVSLLSEYLVETIEDASYSWGISVSFNSMILLPIVGNAAEHAGAIIFAFKDKLDISLGVALGSATQISMFAVPLCVIAAWIMGIDMDLNFNLLETGCLALSIIAVAFTLQDGNSHYLKGLILILLYSVIGACFFVSKTPLTT